MVERVTKKRLTKGLMGLGWATGLLGGALGMRAVAARKRAAADGTAPNSEFAVGRGHAKGPVAAASRAAGYERVDADVRVLVAIMVGSVALLACALATVFTVYGRFDRHFRGQDVGLTAEQRAPITPPLPHLQVAPYRDLDAALMEQERRLTTYGTAAPDGRDAHIPIERAMRQVVGHPLDASAAADAAGPPSDAKAPGTNGPFPSLPGFEATRRQARPANHVEGEERAGAVARSYDPARQPAEAK